MLQQSKIILLDTLINGMQIRFSQSCCSMQIRLCSYMSLLWFNYSQMGICIQSLTLGTELLMKHGFPSFLQLTLWSFYSDLQAHVIPWSLLMLAFVFVKFNFFVKLFDFILQSAYLFSQMISFKSYFEVLLLHLEQIFMIFDFVVFSCSFLLFHSQSELFQFLLID